MAGLAASAPITYHHHHLFPYGKLTDKLLNVNDVPYMIDDHDEDMDRVYPENHFIPFPALSISSFEPKPQLPIITPPNTGTKVLFSFAYRIVPDIIKKFVVVREWDTALVRWHTVARDQ